MKKRNIIIVALIIVIMLVSVGLVSLRMRNNKKIQTEMNNFSSYVLDEKDDFNKLVLGDSKKEYEKLIDKSKDILDENEISSINKTKLDFGILYDKVLKDNEKSYKSKLKEIEKVDISTYDNRKEVQDNIDMANQYVNYKDYKKVKDYIEKINILMSKANTNTNTEVDINVSEDKATKENIENLVRNYLENLPKAIANNDFGYISKYLYPNSNLYNEQKDAVSNWYNQGIKETFKSFTAKDVTFSDNKVEGTLIDEEAFEITKSSGTRTENFNWKYKFKYNTATGDYQITEIAENK